MRTTISLAIAIFIHLGLFYFLLPRNKIVGVLPQSRNSTIDLTNFNVQKNSHTPSLVKAAASSTPAHSSAPQALNDSVPGNPVSSTANTSSNSLEPMPIFMHFEQPEYPKLARLKGLQGKVKIKVFFNNQGTVTNVEILESSTHALLDEAVLKTARRWVSASKQNSVLEKSFEFKLNN